MADVVGFKERRMGERRRDWPRTGTDAVPTGVLRADAYTQSTDLRPPMVRWGPITAGAAIGISLMAILGLLWSAMAYDSQMDFVSNNIEWFLGASAVVALFIGAYLAGMLSAVRGWMPGMIQGITMWAALFIVSIATGISSLLNVAGSPTTSFLLRTAATAGAVDTTAAAGTAAQSADQAITTATNQGSPIWMGFLTLLVTFLAAAIAGGLGGAMARSERLFERSGHPSTSA